jgi:hypothetical protein
VGSVGNTIGTVDVASVELIVSRVAALVLTVKLRSSLTAKIESVESADMTVRAVPPDVEIWIAPPATSIALAGVAVPIPT